VPHTYEYPRGALTVDSVVFGLDDDELDERNFRKPVLAMDLNEQDAD